MDWLSSLVDPLLARAEGVAEHGDAPHQDEDQAHPVEHAELRNSGSIYTSNSHCMLGMEGFHISASHIPNEPIPEGEEGIIY